MNAKHWKTAADRLWKEDTLDCRAAAQLASELTQSEVDALRAAAAQALPSLRAALVKGAARDVIALARRRFGAMRDALHVLESPRFGKRGRDPEVPSPDEHNRRMLNLPSGRRLYGPEIQQAYKRAAKTAHPDGGGSERAFRELCAARDALLKNG